MLISILGYAGGRVEIDRKRRTFMAVLNALRFRGSGGGRFAQPPSTPVPAKSSLQPEFTRRTAGGRAFR